MTLQETVRDLKDENEKVIEQVKKIYSCDSCDLQKKFECSPGHCVIAEVIEVIKNGGSME